MTGVITQKIREIRQQIPESVRLIAVSKQVSPEAIREAYQAGVRDFAENRLQEALIKQEQLQDLTDICWHFIGHLQNNKAKKVLENFDWIHSVDNLKLANRLNILAEELSKSPQVLLQVKMLPDPNKYGWSVAQLKTDLPQLNQLDHLNIQGLMTILPQGLTNAEMLAAFEATRDLASEFSQQRWSNLLFNHLSMGMSADYLLAIQAGATIIRLGTILFS